MNFGQLGAPLKLRWLALLMEAGEFLSREMPRGVYCE